MAYHLCSMPNCRNTRVQDYTVFKMPTQEPTRSQWLRFMLDNGKKNPQKDEIYLCEFHFIPSDVLFVRNHGQKCLKAGSIPIIAFNDASIAEKQIEQLKRQRSRKSANVPKEIKCQCCLKALKANRIRMRVNPKLQKIFETLVGLQLTSGFVCSYCNMNLLAFDNFQIEIRRNHEQEQIMMSRSQQILAEELKHAAKRTYEAKPPVESVVVVKHEEQGAECFNTEFIIREIDPDMETGVTEMSPMEEEELLHDMQTETVEEPAEVIVLSEEPQDLIVLSEDPQDFIDLDEISDEPEPKKFLIETKKLKPETIMYKCEHCTLESSKKEVIVAHIKHSHMFPCTECGQVFSSEDRLKNHEMQSHSTLGNKRKQSLQPTNLKLEDHQNFS